MDRLLRKTTNEKQYDMNFQNGTFIDSGALGVVFKVIHTKTGEEVAAAKLVRLVKPNAEAMTEKEVGNLFSFPHFNKTFSKIELMKGLCHRNIVDLYTSFYTNNRQGIISIMELCDRSLQGCINLRDDVPFPYETLIDYACQILCGLKYLHDSKIIHRDIKPAVFHFAPFSFACLTERSPFNYSEHSHDWRCFENHRFQRLQIVVRVCSNIFFFCFFLIKIFKIEIKREEMSASSYFGTPSYMSPQVAEETKYTNKTDVWSTGVVFIAMVTLKNPKLQPYHFKGLDPQTIVLSAETFSSLHLLSNGGCRSGCSS